MTIASGLARASFSCVEAEEVEVLARRGHVGALHALALQAQHHDDVGAVEAFAHVGEDFDAHPLDAGRQQRRGRDDAHPGAERVEQDDVGAGDAAMQDVAADRHRQARDAPLGAADGERVEQRLGRMLVRAVAGVDHGAVDLLRQQLDRARPRDGARR